MSVPLIVWEKWKDPLLTQLGNSDTQNDEEDEYEEPDFNQYNERPKKALWPAQVVMTPFGFLSINENLPIGEVFNFWIAHSNFAITKKISNMIEETEGVETLEVYTKYRFKIGVGKAFSDSETMRHINNKIYAYVGDNND